MKPPGEQLFSSHPQLSAFKDLPDKLLVDGALRRVLDLGCGVGEHIKIWAAKHPNHHFDGVDISRPNIEVAKQSNLANVEFHCEDLMEYRSKGYDFVFSYSTIQLLAAGDEDIYCKLFSLLKPGGTLVLGIPYACASNHLIWLVRSLLRRIRGNWLDELALRASKFLHPALDEDYLRERIPYIYMPARRYDGASMRREMLGQGLQFVASAELPFVSLGQTRHRLVTYQRI